MKEQLIEQIEGLKAIKEESRNNKAMKISSLFHEVFDLKDVEYSNLNIGSERAEFSFNNEYSGQFTVLYYKTYGDDETKLEVSVPSSYSEDVSRLIQWGKIAKQIFEKGDEFLTKLEVLRNEYKAGIEVTNNMLYEAETKLKFIQNQENAVDLELTKTALRTVGHQFETGRWVQVGATDSVYTDYVRIEQTPGKKTYKVHYVNLGRPATYERVREVYINQLAQELINNSKNA